MCQQSFSLRREKRSFSWPSFFGGSSSTDVVENETPQTVASVQDFQVVPQQHVEIPIQNLSPGYHYPIWRVHKYNGIELKPMPVSLVRQQHLQQLHTQIPYSQLQQWQQLHPSQLQGQQHESVAARQPQFHSATASNCRPKAAIPPELQDLAQQFGIKDASKLPSLEDAMGLLGTTSRAETIQTIKELAATPDGMNLIRQFLASDEGAAASEDPSNGNQCDDVSLSQPAVSQDRQNRLPNTDFRHGSSSNLPLHQEYGVPKAPQQHNVYGLPNAQQGAPFRQQPESNIMSLIKQDAVVPHEQYGVPNELSTAHSEHQGYNTPKISFEQSQHGHEVYGLPDVKPAVPFQQGYYAPRTNRVESAKSEAAPHKEYNVPSEESNAAHETHEEYGLPNVGETNASQHEVYGLPNAQEHTDGGFVDTQQEYGLPSAGESSASDQQKSYGLPSAGESNASEHHESYGLPHVQEPVNFLQQGHYPPQTETTSSNAEETIVPHQEYNVPMESSHQSQVPHGTYGVPSDSFSLPNTVNNNRFAQPDLVPEPHQSYEIGSNEKETVQFDQQQAHNQYALPATSTVNLQTSNTAQSNDGHRTAYALPHQRFFEAPSTSKQAQYGAPTKFTSNNQRTYVPIFRQVDGALDRANTNLYLGELLTTTLRPDAGFLERVGAWTRYFAPPGPTVPIVPPQVTENVLEDSVDHSQKAYAIPIPKIPELNEPHLSGLPQAPQLPNVYIPKKFVAPSTLHQGPFVRIQQPLASFSSVPNSGLELPHQPPQPFDGQSVEEFVPDISQLPLDQRNLGKDLRTSYGISTHPHSYASDSSFAASETTATVASPNQSGKFLDLIENEEIVENDVANEEPEQKKFGPQRISSYDSYATGKLNRANDDAIIQLIPTQKPYTNQARRMGQLVEDASIIDTIATMTSGFRPITK